MKSGFQADGKDKMIPSNCTKCDFCRPNSGWFSDSYLHCCINNKGVDDIIKCDTIPGWCPLINKEAGCNCCQSENALYWKDNENNAFVDSKGGMLVTIKGMTIRYKVKCCPNCGRAL